MVDSGVTPAAAANVLRVSVPTVYKHLLAEERRVGRKAKRSPRMRSKATGGDMRSANSRGGKKSQAARKSGWAESHAEHLARLAPLLREVTEQHSVKG